MNILVIDSDHDLVEMLTGWLRGRGHTVHFGWTADRLRQMWREHQPDLVILDVNVAGVDVLALCRELRAQHDALILALSPERDPHIETHCLESGADAFLLKPFLPKQLLAHMHALGRRVRSTLRQQPLAMVVVGPIHFDTSRNEITVNGRISRLTPTEGRILQLLAINNGDVCTLDQIVSHVWGYSGEGDTYLIKAHIHHLREKVEPDPNRPEFIRTVPGIGYMLTLANWPGADSRSQEQAARAPSTAAYQSDTGDTSDTSDTSAGVTRGDREEREDRVVAPADTSTADVESANTDGLDDLIIPDEFGDSRETSAP